MKLPTHLVVSSPPSKHQGSVLAQVVAGQSALGQLLYWIAFCNANARLLASVQAELAALRATKLFSFTVSKDIEASSGKSVLELCWETIERVQYLTRRIALYPEAYRERIEGSGKFHYFLIRLAGVAGGPVAESKAMAPRFDRRVRDKEAEAACPNYLIETIPYVPMPRLFGPISPETKAAFKKYFLGSKEQIAFPNAWYESQAGRCDFFGVTKTLEDGTVEQIEAGAPKLIGQDCTDEQIAAWYPYTKNGVPNSSSVPSSFYGVTTETGEKKVVSLPVKPWVDGRCETFLTLYGESPRNANGVNPRKGETREQYAAPHRNGELGKHLPNWCPTCQQYVKWRHDGPTGIPCKDYLKMIKADEVKRVATMYAPTEQVVPRRDPTSCSDGPINTNWVENKWIARLDSNKALRRLFAKCGEPCVEDAPKTRTQRKPKRHYVRHGEN